ncbi:MAG: hypothetical protein ACOVKO_09230 [Elstera sp.]
MIVKTLYRAAALAAGLLACAPSVSAQTPADVNAAVRSLVGTWQTVPRETPSPGGAKAFVRQTLQFTETRERVKVEAFADAALTQKLFTYDSEGPYSITGPWPAIPGAFAADLRNDRSEMTIMVDAPEIWASINMASCPLKIGVAVDITDCVKGPPFQVTKCVDLDLVHFSNDYKHLQMGAGDVNRCEERPKKLNPVVFIRQ